MRNAMGSFGGRSDKRSENLMLRSRLTIEEVGNELRYMISES